MRTDTVKKVDRETYELFLPRPHPHYPNVICCNGPMGESLRWYFGLRYLQGLLED